MKRARRKLCKSVRCYSDEYDINAEMEVLTLIPEKPHMIWQFGMTSFQMWLQHTSGSSHVGVLQLWGELCAYLQESGLWHPKILHGL